MMLVLVARRARDRRILERLRAVAFLASDGCVQADQWEASEFVIERNLFQPLRFVVAGLATFAELAFVWIIGFVA